MRFIFLLIILMAMGCTPGVITKESASPTQVPSPTPTPSLEQILEQVQRMLDEAATLDYSLQRDAVAEAVALYLSRPDWEQLIGPGAAEELQEYMNQAGLETFIGVTFAVVETDPRAYVVHFGYNTIWLYWGPPGQPLKYQVITWGDLVSETRLVGNELGVIFYFIGASTVTPDFVLLRQEDGDWNPIWPLLPEEPTPWRELWITADGEVKIAADGLSLISTVGSSWGVFLEEDPFFECHVCPHRYFEILWERQGDLYVPKVTLPPDAPLYDRLWEVTRPSFYASLFEFLRRLRAGDEAGAAELVADPVAIDQTRALGLDDPTRNFISDFPDMPAHGMVFVFYENLEEIYPPYEASFQLLTAEQEHWLIDEIRQVEPEG